jgi:hypothetical protein
MGSVHSGRQPGKGEHSLLPFSTYSAPGGLRQDPGCDPESSAVARTCRNGSTGVRVLLSTYGSRGDVEPLVALAVRLRELGAEVRASAVAGAIRTDGAAVAAKLLLEGSC